MKTLTEKDFDDYTEHVLKEGGKPNGFIGVLDPTKHELNIRFRNEGKMNKDGWVKPEFIEEYIKAIKEEHVSSKR